MPDTRELTITQNNITSRTELLTRRFIDYDVSSLIHSAVVKVVDDMIQSNGLKALAPAERSPKMRDFFLIFRIADQLLYCQ